MVCNLLKNELKTDCVCVFLLAQYFYDENLNQYTALNKRSSNDKNNLSQSNNIYLFGRLTGVYRASCILHSRDINRTSIYYYFTWKFN